MVQRTVTVSVGQHFPAVSLYHATIWAASIKLALVSIGCGTLYVCVQTPQHGFLPLLHHAIWFPKMFNSHNEYNMISTALPWCRGTHSCSSGPWPPLPNTQSLHLDPVSYTCHSSSAAPREFLTRNRRWRLSKKVKTLLCVPRFHFLELCLEEYLLMLVFRNASNVSSLTHMGALFGFLVIG